MTTVSPNYQQRGQFNPFYVMKSAVIASSHTALTKNLKNKNLHRKIYSLSV